MDTGERGSSAGSAAGGGGGGGEAAAAAPENCSVCLESVGGRSVTKLQCGHEFHLDCIGSAFNAKGVMQCPNCRQIEEGNWLNATGSSTSQSAYVSLSDYVFEEWTDDEALDLNDSEMSSDFSGLQWCPFDRLAQQLAQEGESSRSRTYQDPFDSPPRPNASYHQLLQATFPSNPHPSSESLQHAFHRQWGHTYGPNALSGSFYSGWEPYYQRHRPNNHPYTVNHAPSSSATRTARLVSDVQPRARHGSSSRTGGSFTPYIDINVGPLPRSRGPRNHQNPPAPTMDLQPPVGSQRPSPRAPHMHQFI